MYMPPIPTIHLELRYFRVCQTLQYVSSSVPHVKNVNLEKVAFRFSVKPTDRYSL